VTVPDAVADVPPLAGRRRSGRPRWPAGWSGRRGESAGSRPALPVALRPVWRSGNSLQFGVDPARAMVVDGVDEPMVCALLSLDGGRTTPEVLAEAAAEGLDPALLGRLIEELSGGGVLVEAAGPPAAGGVPADPALGRAATRLAPDRAALSLLAGGEDEADLLLGRRRGAAVVVHVADRVGVTLATLLAAAGVGQVQVVDRGSVRPGDVAPGGLSAADVHRSRGAAAADAMRRAAPEVVTDPIDPARLPDLVVLASTRPVDTDLRTALQQARLPNLVVGVRETAAIVGPLVLPGRTTCLRCTDLHRADSDPAWPLLAAQLAEVRTRRVEPCDVVLATLAAATGALQALTHLDGGAPAALGGTLELVLPDWRLRRRTWPPHPRCGCGAWPDGGHAG
jgi:hypothetical protein